MAWTLSQILASDPSAWQPVTEPWLRKAVGGERDGIL